METGTSSVSVIGLGLMGAALAGAYLEAGYRTTVWNRSAGKAYAVVEQGATNAADIAEAVAASDVLVCVVDYAAFSAILEPVRDKQWITHVVLPSMKGAAVAVDSGEYATSASTTALNAIGLGKLVEASTAAGLRPDLPLPIKAYPEKRVADGHGDEALAGMVEVIRSPER